MKDQQSSIRTIENTLPIFLLTGLVFPVIAGFIILLLEYHSGWFAGSISGGEAHGIDLKRLMLSVSLSTMLILDALFFSIIGLIWIRRQNYGREHFAFSIMMGYGLLALILLISSIFHTTPWHGFRYVWAALHGTRVQELRPDWAQYAFLWTLFVLLSAMARQKYRSWDGLKTTLQFEREQRQEPNSLFIDAYTELASIRRRQRLTVHQDATSSVPLQLSIEPITDSLAWKDQARELVRLGCSAYEFDSELGWQPSQDCWTGLNLDTNACVLLYPLQFLPTSEQCDGFVEYAERQQKINDSYDYEVIVAIKNERDISNNKLFHHKIRVETEESLLGKIINFSDYRNQIKRRVLIDRLPDAHLNLHDVYVPSPFLHAVKSQTGDDVEQYLQTWLNEPGQRQIALLGEYGQGKSTAALMLTYRLLHETDIHEKRVPILIELRGMSPRNLTPLQLLGAWASRYNINPQALMRLHLAGRVLLIFEGFDEMALIGDAEMRLKHFKTLWEFCHPNAKLIITGRPNFFLDQQEMKTALGMVKPLGDSPYCEAIRLQPFTLPQIEQALRKYEENVRRQICEISKRNQGFRDLVSRPSLLHLVSALWVREDLKSKAESLNSAEVLRLFVRNSYRRQGLKEADTTSPDFMALTAREREYFMRGIACHMAAKQLPNQIGTIQLNKLIELLIESMPDSVSTETTAIERQSISPLRLRLIGPESNQRLEHLKTDVRTCGLLVDDPAAPGTFRFGHKSFMEYLFAEVLAEHMQPNPSIDALSILTCTGATLDDISGLPVSMEFLAEILAAPYMANSTVMDKESVAKDLLRLCLEFKFSRTLVSFWARILLIRRAAMIVGLALRSDQRTDIPELPRIFARLIVLALIPTADERGKSAHTGLSRTEVRFGIWNSACKRLRISDRIMHDVAGISIFPEVKKLPFECLLEEPDKWSNSRQHDDRN